MLRFGMHEARAQLSRLVGLALAGDDVVLVNRGKPVARLVPFNGEPSTQPARAQGADVRRGLDQLAEAILRRRAGQEVEWDRIGIPQQDESTGRLLSHLERLELATLSPDLHRADDSRRELDEHVAFVTALYEGQQEMAWHVVLLEALLPEFGRTDEPDYVPLSSPVAARLVELKRELRIGTEDAAHGR